MLFSLCPEGDAQVEMLTVGKHLEVPVFSPGANAQAVMDGHLSHDQLQAAAWPSAGMKGWSRLRGTAGSGPPVSFGFLSQVDLARVVKHRA